MPLPFNQESWIWYTCAVSMIGARLISRKILFRSIKGLQCDDWIMGLFVTASYTVMIVLANKWLKVHSNLEPGSFDFSALGAEEHARRRYGSKLVVVVEQTQIAVMWSCKACLLIMYHRITRTALRNENIAIKILSAYVALGFIVIEVLYFAAWCRPFSDYYAVPTGSSQCNALVHHRITKAVFNISSDLIMLSIALQMLIRSLLPMKRKIILCGIFSLGIFVVFSSIMNSYYSLNNPYRSTWIYWYVRESSTAILVANLPFTWTVLREVFEVDDFDKTNPPPWTYHSPRTAGGRKTAQLLRNQTGTAGVHTCTHMSPANSNGSRGTQSMTLVSFMSAAKEHRKAGTNSERSEDTGKDLLGEAIQPHDSARTVLQMANDGTINLDLESGLTDEAHLRPVSADYDHERNKLASCPPRTTMDGTDGFFIKDRPISSPSRAHLATSNRTRDDSAASRVVRPMSPNRRHTSTVANVHGRGESAGSQAGTDSQGAVGGGRSASDRRARTRMSG
ncbi:hypothetical protein EJ02DRAFT_352234 [Clathrospora elynae]|uniref:Rhodopsin domain-containing protein n=1 Tax=Clathrospora elynae TaxID=706981 RepID=A0A6A5SQS4_9PLEO|nr:hypothetical protein EJ02DRAFT_352234 [Clathrospora elynae]